MVKKSWADEYLVVAVIARLIRCRTLAGNRNDWR